MRSCSNGEGNVSSSAPPLPAADVGLQPPSLCQSNSIATHFTRFLQSCMNWKVSFVLLQVTSVQILKDSILTRVTVRSMQIQKSDVHIFSSSGITDVIMDFPESTLVKLDFCGTKLSRHVSGLPTMTNAPRDQRLSKLKTHAMLLNSSASLAGFHFHHLVLTCVGCLIIMVTFFLRTGASLICGFATGITIAETTVTRGTVRT